MLFIIKQRQEFAISRLWITFTIKRGLIRIRASMGIRQGMKYSFIFFPNRIGACFLAANAVPPRIFEIT